MFEEQIAIEKLALFFYFSFMDEAKALNATRICLSGLRRKTENKPSSNWEVALVRETYQVAQKQKEMGGLSRVGFVQGHVIFPTGSNWGPWFEYRKTAKIEEFSTLIWVNLLGISLESVAQGLGVTIGTVKFRLSNGLKELGTIVQPEGVA